MSMKPFIRLIAALALLAPAAAHAEEPTLISTHGDWSAYSFNENGNKVCYMASKPKKAEGAYKQRGDVFALITHRPSENTKNTFSYIAGYGYKAGSEPAITIDGKTYKLYVHKDTAWASDAETDNKIAAALRKGSKMSVKGTSSRGTLTTDTFSLKGTGAAYDAISKACGVN